jgi:hypothetical protein
MNVEAPSTKETQYKTEPSLGIFRYGYTAVEKPRNIFSAQRP